MDDDFNDFDDSLARALVLMYLRPGERPNAITTLNKISDLHLAEIELKAASLIKLCQKVRESRK